MFCLWLMLINVITILENSGMPALLPNSNSEWWKNLLPPWAAFISRRIRFGLQITTFATVLTRPLNQLPKSKMRTALKQRFEVVWSKTNQEVLQDNSDMDCTWSVSLLALSLMLKFLNTSFCKTNSAEKPKLSFLGGKKALVTQLPRCFLTCALVRKRVSLDWHCANIILCILLYLIVFCIALYFSAHTKKGSLGTDTELTRHFVTLFASWLLVGGVHILWWLTLRTCLERF